MIGALVASFLLGADFQRVADLLPQIKVAATESGIDPYLLAGLVYAESRGKADALSSVEAGGYCQLLLVSIDCRFDGSRMRAIWSTAGANKVALVVSSCRMLG